MRSVRSLLPWTLASLGLLAFNAATQAAQPPEAPVRVISADVSDIAGPMNRMHNFCVGAGRANEGLRADWQRQLTMAHEECGFRYIRFHGLFTDDMGVYFEENGEPVYNWQYVDELFDFIERIGMKPFIELGFMPSQLASGTQTIFWWRGNITPPKDYDRWADFIAAFVEHVTERYGAEEVRTWYFEVWNEPNLDGFWMGNPDKLPWDEWAPGALAEYLKLYATTARAVKSVDPTYRVGGPATAGESWIDETLAYCAENDVPLDFISTHSYATMGGFLDEYGNTGTVLSPDPESITAGVRNVRAKIDASPFPEAELHYTEWSSSYTPADPIHDTYHSTAFILDKMKNIGTDATSMSYWTFTDIFEEPGPRKTPFHGGFGMINYQDLTKPAYYTFKFLNALGDTVLKQDDPAAYVCRDEAGAVQALFWDFSLNTPPDGVNNQDYYNTDLPAAPVAPVALDLAQLSPGTYRLQATKVGYRSNDVQTAYLDMGKPSQLTRAQVATLRAASDGRPEIDEVITVGADGQFAREFPMRENDVWLVELTPQS